MSLSYNSTSETDSAVFYASSALSPPSMVAFHPVNSTMGVYGVNGSTTTQYGRWYICETYINQYYDTLSWAVSGGPTANASCEKVDVVRQFV